MVGNISELTTAAVVVSAVDGSRTAQQTQDAATASTGVENTPAYAVGEQAPVEAAEQTANEEDYTRDEDGKKEKRQALDGLNEKFVSEMTKELNELMSKLNCDLEFHYHKEVDVMSVKMVDKNTKKVIKEYPPEDMVEGMINAKEWLGTFLDKKV